MTSTQMKSEQVQVVAPIVYQYPTPVKPLVHSIRKQRLSNLDEIKGALVLSYLRFQCIRGGARRTDDVFVNELNEMADVLDEQATAVKHERPVKRVRTGSNTLCSR